MPDRGILGRRTSRLARALDGHGVIDSETAPLLGVAARLHANARQPVPRPLNVAAARLKMLRAVNEQAAERAAGSHGAKVRGATLGAAAVAGAGLLMASAATNSDPIGVVRATVLEFPALVAGSSAPEAEDVTLVGTIISVDEAANKVEVDTGETRVAVDLQDVPKRDQEREAAPAVAVGSVVEVDGSVREGDTTIRAREVTIREPATTVSLAPAERPVDGAAPTEPASTKPVAVADITSVVNVKPSTPTATATPIVDDIVTNSIGTLATPRPILTPTPTPTPTPTEKPRPTATLPAIDPTLPGDLADTNTDSSNLDSAADAPAEDGTAGTGAATD